MFLNYFLFPEDFEKVFEVNYSNKNSSADAVFSLNDKFSKK